MWRLPLENPRVKYVVTHNFLECTLDLWVCKFSNLLPTYNRKLIGLKNISLRFIKFGFKLFTIGFFSLSGISSRLSSTDSTEFKLSRASQNLLKFLLHFSLQFREVKVNSNRQDYQICFQNYRQASLYI